MDSWYVSDYLITSYNIILVNTKSQRPYNYFSYIPRYYILRVRITKKNQFFISSSNLKFWISISEKKCTAGQKIKKVQAKKKNSWNFFSGSFELFPQFKNRFLVIFEIAKNWIGWKTIFREIDLLDFTSFFFAWTFLIFWPTVCVL